MELDEIRKFALKVWKFKEGELVAVMIHVGDRLGLYQAMAGSGPMTPDELASVTNTDMRWIQEWLYGQAAAGLVNHDDGQFELTPVGAAVLADEEESQFFAAGAFTGITNQEVIEQLIEAMRTGGGFSYEDQGEVATRTTERMSRPSFTKFFLPVVIPAIPGLKDRLTTGANVVEVGCGSGVAIDALARAFPASHFLGVDPSSIAVGRARERSVDLDNAEFREGHAEELASYGQRFGVVLALDALHDMPHPDRALAAVRSVLEPDGVMVIQDIKSKPGFENNLRNPVLALQYGFSLTSCLASGLSETGGMGLGTLGFNPEVAERLVREAGFSRFAMHDLEAPTELFYEVRI
ncbi:MAG: methyltransferase domain-containing protein [Acidimicrobiia bacterium]|nr:methyltransferase domain-containing protein [Acidimicrobiia bacterium]NND14096.1 methyltransferase domain-containing protein [Acidimicrobiia bacterium]NNL47559.1 methyltransferase domain-containing protein [Acidimicrobiia bacterium]